MSIAFRDTWIYSFPHVWCKSMKSFCSDRNDSPNEIYKKKIGPGELRNVSLNLFWQFKENGMPGYVRQWTLIILVKERYSSNSTVERHLMDSSRWHVNYTELQPSINILIWVTWIVDHPDYLYFNIAQRNVIKSKLFELR